MTGSGGGFRGGFRGLVRTSSRDGLKVLSVVCRGGRKGVDQGGERAGGDCLPQGPGEVVMGRRQGRGPSEEQLWGSVQKR